MKTQITCRCCNGTGTQPLESHLQEVLDYLEKHGPAAASDLHQVFMPGAHLGAMCNRLVGLLQLGLVERYKTYGQPGYTYRVVVK